MQRDAKGKIVSARAKDGRAVVYDGIGTMSKSKNNGVDPQALIDRYGADTARFFIIYASPPTNTLEWSDEGVDGSFRFLKRVWNFASRISGETPAQSSKEARFEIHSVLKQANYDMQKHQFNTVASAAMKILNALERSPSREGLSILLRLLAPVTPHIAHHLWRELEFGEDILQAPWPEPARDALEQDEVEYVLQVNGKKKGSFRVPKGASEKETAALAISAAQSYLGDQKTKKEIVVPGRLVNLVV